MRIMLLLSITLTFFSCASSEIEVTRKINNLNLKLVVGYLDDKNLPTTNAELIEKSLYYAKAAISKSFGISGIDFTLSRKIPIESYFNETIPLGHSQSNVLDPFFERISFNIQDSQKLFYKNYNISELREFIPISVRESIETVEQYHKYTMEKWIAQSKFFIDASFEGRPVFTKDSIQYQTYSRWKKLCDYQSDFDLIFTNTLIFYDDLDNPYPHTIYRYAKVGGMGEYSPKAPNPYKGLFIVSSIEYSGINHFSTSSAPSIDEQAQELAYYLIAHEFGHAALKLQDVYDHPNYCIMNTNDETLDIKEAVKSYNSHDGPCEKCRESIISGKRQLLSAYGISG